MGKINLFVLSVFILLSLAFLPSRAALAGTSPTTRVESLDDALANAIRTELGLAVDAVITDSDMEALTELDASGMEIKDLAGLEKATNLLTLDLSMNNISDLHPLEGLMNITTMNLNNNKIYDLSPLRMMAEISTDRNILATNQLIEIETAQPVTDGTMKYPYMIVNLANYPTFKSASSGGIYNPDAETVSWSGL